MYKFYALAHLFGAYAYSFNKILFFCVYALYVPLPQRAPPETCEVSVHRARQQLGDPCFIVRLRAGIFEMPAILSRYRDQERVK